MKIIIVISMLISSISAIANISLISGDWFALTKKSDMYFYRIDAINSKDANNPHTVYIERAYTKNELGSGNSETLKCQAMETKKLDLESSPWLVNYDYMIICENGAIEFLVKKNNKGDIIIEENEVKYYLTKTKEALPKSIRDVTERKLTCQNMYSFKMLKDGEVIINHINENKSQGITDLNEIKREGLFSLDLFDDPAEKGHLVMTGTLFNGEKIKLVLLDFMGLDNAFYTTLMVYKNVKADIGTLEGPYENGDNPSDKLSCTTVK